MGCRCKGKGRLIIKILSNKEKIRLKLIDQSNYIDYYDVCMNEGEGRLLLDNIHEGYIRIETNDTMQVYEPSQTIYFDTTAHTHTLLIKDGR